MGFILLSTADFHQAGSNLPAHARGRQCVPCCMIYLLTVHIDGHLHITSSDLNGIMVAGSHLYIETPKASSLMDPCELPKQISYKNNMVAIDNTSVLSGFLSRNSNQNNSSCFSLEMAFTKQCIDSSYFISVQWCISCNLF